MRDAKGQDDSGGLDEISPHVHKNSFPLGSSQEPLSQKIQVRAWAREKSEREIASAVWRGSWGAIVWELQIWGGRSPPLSAFELIWIRIIVNLVSK